MNNRRRIEVKMEPEQLRALMRFVDETEKLPERFIPRSNGA